MSGWTARTVAVLFDEFGLDRYAALCRSSITAAVHHAWDQSETAGFAALRKARAASGIEPPTLEDFEWGSVMGMEEACAHMTVEVALERAIATGDLVVGAKTWRQTQRRLAEEVFDGDHPSG